MERAHAETLASLLRALEAPLNELSTASEPLQGEESIWFRKQIGQMMAAGATMELEIGRLFPDLDPDRQAH